MMDMTFGSFGFTGTRQGMTRIQAKNFISFMLANGDSVTDFHHGCAIGADAEANDLMLGAMPWVRRHGHPSNIVGQRAMVNLTDCEKPLPPLQRNDVIVKACQVLCACPGENQEVLRSGTWATIRHAVKDKLVVIFYPDGRVQQNKEMKEVVK